MRIALALTGIGRHLQVAAAWSCASWQFRFYQCASAFIQVGSLSWILTTRGGWEVRPAYCYLAKMQCRTIMMSGHDSKGLGQGDSDTATLLPLAVSYLLLVALLAVEIRLLPPVARLRR